jgi:glycerol-3-phosphate cytidylyltransferase
MKKDTIGITASAFDLLHAGHILMLREAKSICDYLICALQTDPTLDRPNKNVPVQTYMERYIQLDAVKYVDEIIPYSTEEELLALLHHLPIDIRIIGEDYYGKEFTGKDLTNMKIHYNKRRHEFSTTNLKQRVAAYSNPVRVQNLVPVPFPPSKN